MASTESNESARIPMEEYVSMLKGLSLTEVILTSCDTAVDPGLAKVTDVSSVPVSITDAADVETEDGTVTIRHKYNVRAKSGRRRLFYLKAEFAVRMTAANGVNTGFLDVFRDTSLPLVTWPYLRELVGSVTERMGLPRLRLGLWKAPF